MIISQKCNCCVHEAICILKPEYFEVCETVKNSCCGTNNGGTMKLKDFQFDIHIKCPNMLATSKTK